MSCTESVRGCVWLETGAVCSLRPVPALIALACCPPPSLPSPFLPSADVRNSCPMEGDAGQLRPNRPHLPCTVQDRGL
eukprot:1781269-Rhodomonas_salina.1